MADMLLGGIVINEILIDPNGTLNFDTDSNGTANATDEYVELYNASSSSIDISGLELWDQGVGQWFIFPSGTILEAGAHALVMSGVQTGGALPTGAPDDLFFDAGRASPLINNGGDNVTVYDPTNNEFIQATYNGDTLDNPALGAASYAGFNPTATRVGLGEDFGNDTDGQSLQRFGDGADIFVSDGPTPGVTNVCFADGTFLDTPSGPRAVECLRIGDLVLTADHGPQPVTWTYSKKWTACEMSRNQTLAPVLIRADALGHGMPSQDLRLSQQHRVLVTGPIARRMFGQNEVLVPANALLALAGIGLDTDATDTTCYHIMLSKHEIVASNNVATESLFLGEQAVASMPRMALLEISELLSIPLDALGTGTGPILPVRLFVTGRRAKRLVARHRKNRRALSACLSTVFAARSIAPTPAPNHL